MLHKFNIDITMTATLNETVAMQIISEAVEKETGKKVSDIRINYDGTKFNGFQVIFDPHAKKQAFKPSKEFIVNHFGAEE